MSEMHDVAWLAMAQQRLGQIEAGLRRQEATQHSQAPTIGTPQILLAAIMARAALPQLPGVGPISREEVARQILGVLDDLVETLATDPAEVRHFVVRTLNANGLMPGDGR